VSKPFPLIEQVRAVLPADGWTLRAGDDWCYVVPPDYPFVSQGWKVHVSATPLSALLVLHRCAKVLVELGYAFKFAPTFDRLMDLLNRDADRGSAGKFLTVYPPEGADLTRLMAELHRQTSGLPGPQILSDRPYAPRSLVHLRYGAHVDAPRLTDEGELRTPLVAPDGSFVPDRREAWFTMPDWAELPIPASPDEDDEPDLLLAGRYRVHTAIQQANKGGVYQARDELADRDVIVKQARAHVGATLSGQDSQTLLRAEADALDALHRYGVCPRKLDLFTLGDSLFLVEEALEGETLADWVTHRLQPGSRFDDMLPAPEIRDLATRIVDLVVTVHAAGLRLGDLTPSNLMVCADGAVRCIDLEGAGRFGTPAAPIGTHAYQPPELPGLVAQQADPGVEGDLHALGGVLFFLVTGADPAILPDDTRHDRLARMLDLLAPVTALRAGILGLMADDPAVRWPLDRVRAWPSGDFQRGSSEEPTLGELLDDLVEGISGGGAAGFDARTVCAGAAGRLALLTRADPRGPAVDALVGQLYADPPAGPVLPGLYTGTAGVAWAGFDLAQARGDDPGRALALARQIPTDWHVPDVFHGLAGAGLTFAHLWRQGAGEEFRGRVVACADNLSKQAVETAHGLMWRLPDGRAAYGFAHGVAGIGTFLSVAAEITGDDRYRELAIRAGQTLAANAQGDGDAAWWYADPVEQEIGGYPVSAAHWCNGASGVGTFVLRLGFVDLARRAATTVLREARGATVCYCHGLAGNGDFLLDMADRLGEEKYRDGAERLARLIAVTAARKDGRLVTPDDTKKAVSAGFATGTTGTAIFLHRLLYGGPRWGMASLD
jgi:tRNA A-37 threonylcarbamoyl transferase component Bud32